MKDERWQRVKSLFDAGVQIPASDRGAFLDQMCAGDATLRHEVESLIAAHERTGEFLDSPAYHAISATFEDFAQLQVGQSFGNYEILSLLGQGGMGEVYLALDRKLGRKVAIKLLPAYLTQNSERLSRFVREARAASSLNHPNILTIHEVGEVEGSHFIATEFVDGDTLRRQISDGPVGLPAAIRITEQILSALTAAHSEGIAHRDIKPENVMVRRDGIVKVLDFGLAKIADESASRIFDPKENQVRTEAGVVLGTIRYMSPEQARGLDVDSRSDLWSVGVVLYEMVTGTAPFEGPTPSDVIAAILEREPPPLSSRSPDLPPELESVVQRALTKDRDTRYQSARVMLADLLTLKQQLERRATGSLTRKGLLGNKQRRLLYYALATLLIVSLGLVVFKLRVPQTELVSQGGLTVLNTAQLTTSSGLDLYPAFSPDGTALAYCSDRNGAFEIYVKQLSTGGREIQITSDGQQNLEPAWSPDGQQIAYHSKNRRGIWVVPSLGGVPRQVTDFGSYPAWSPDGSLIAFQSAGLGEAVLGNSSGAVMSSQIWVTGLKGEQPKPITQAGNPSSGQGTPGWSPDGKRISFTAYNLAKPSEVWSVSPDGSDLRIVVRGCSEPVYSPDGKSMFVIGVPKGQPFGVWQLIIEPSSNNVIGEPIKVLHAGPTNVRHLTVSSNGKRIAYETRSQTSNIWTIPLTLPEHNPGGGPVGLVRETTFRNTTPSFSRDGKKILFSQYRIGEGESLWLINADGSGATQVTTKGGSSPSWSINGDEVMFWRQSEGHSVLKSIPVIGGTEREILDLGPGSSFGRISPDGKQVVYNLTSGGVTNLWITSIEKLHPKQLTFDQESMGFGCWSPDGKLLALGIKRGEDNFFGIMPSAGGEVRQLITEHGVSSPGSWSPDGDKITFAGNRNGYWNVYWVSRSTGAQQQLTNYNRLNIGVRYPTWSPLGNQILYEYSEVNGNIWLIDLK